MKPINVCIVVFNRYDLLAKLVQSVECSVLAPGREVSLYIVDRGHRPYEVAKALNGVVAELVDLPGQSLPAAWNWFIQNVPEERIITSDDIEFHQDGLETMAHAQGDLVGLDDGKSSAFACFLIRDSCVRKVGLFDETLSPDYMYFEDTDYARRMALLGVPVVGVRCMDHGLSRSWEFKTPEQRSDHHRRFVLAEQNYARKWGGVPGHETRTTV